MNFKPFFILNLAITGFVLCQDESVSAVVDSADNITVSDEQVPEDVIARETSGWNVGAAASVGFVKGETFTEVPTGATVVITTPYGFKLGPFDYTISLGAGGYTGEHNAVAFDPNFIGVGGNLTFAKFIFAEGHLGMVGEGSGFRGFAGVTLEKIMKKSMNLPFNLLVGSEAFYSTDMAGAGNASYWAALGLRLDYNF